MFQIVGLDSTHNALNLLSLSSQDVIIKLLLFLRSKEVPACDIVHVNSLVV